MMKNSPQFIGGIVVGGLILAVTLFFIFWPKIEKALQKYLEKKYAVKIIKRAAYLRPIPGSDVNDHYFSITIKGKLSKIKKAFIAFQYLFFSLFTAFLPLLIWGFFVFYYLDELRPILNSHF